MTDWIVAFVITPLMVLAIAGVGVVISYYAARRHDAARKHRADNQ